MKAVRGCQDNHQQLILKYYWGRHGQTAHSHRSYWDSCQGRPVLQEDWITLCSSAKLPPYEDLR